MPPFSRRFWLRTGANWERAGSSLWPAFAGVILVEATKQLYQGIPALKRHRMRQPAFRPALIPPASAFAPWPGAEDAGSEQEAPAPR